MIQDGQGSCPIVSRTIRHYELADMRICVVIPLRNEERSIRSLLDSLTSQALPPAEIAITDGGSTDNTLAIIQEYVSRGTPILLTRTPAALPGRGRNLSAAQATSEWLAFTDGGIQPSRDWLAELAHRAEQTGAEVIYGSWEPVINSFFAECAAIAYVPPPTEKEGLLLRPPFIASTLIRKSVWEAVGGFPEDLRSAEDLLFIRRIEDSGTRVAFAPRAVVQWELQPTLRLTFRRFALYARHNMRAGLWREWQAALLRRYLLLGASAVPALVLGWRWLVVPAGLWVMLLLARGVAAIWRNRHCYPASPGRNLLRLACVAPLLAVIDTAGLIGTAQWLARDKLLPKQGAEQTGDT
jgi:glycosyltransferase involved in cell wall biosynthesis